MERLLSFEELKEVIHVNHEKRLDVFRDEGRKDGESNLPNVLDEMPTETEFEIRNKYKSDISMIQQNINPLLQEPLQEYKNLIKEKDYFEKNKNEYTMIRLKQLDDNKARLINELDKKVEQQVENLEVRKKPIIVEFQEVEDQYKDVTERLGRKEPIIYLKSGIIEWTILLFLGMCEIPLNFTVFANFQLTNVETYLLSFLLVVAIPFLSHYSGICFRQYEENPKYKNHLVIIIFLILALNVLVGFLRVDYIKQIMGYEIQIVGTLTFILLGIIIYSVGVIISFLHHDKSQELMDAYDRYLEAKEIFEKKMSDFAKEQISIDNMNESELARINKDYSAEKELLDTRLEFLNDNIQNKIKEYNYILNFAKGLEREVYSNYKVCLSDYRKMNHRYRKNQKRPISWGPIKPLYLLIGNMEELKYEA